MNAADETLDRLNNIIIGLPETDLRKDIGKNISGNILICLSKSFDTPYHKGELNIHLKPGENLLQSNNIDSRDIDYKYKKNPSNIVSIIHSTNQNNFIVAKNNQSYYYSNTENLRIKYPRSWNEKSFIEQTQSHKMTSQRTNIMIKILTNKYPNQITS